MSIASILQYGVEAATAAIDDSCGRSVTYHRGAASVVVTATQGERPYERTDRDGFLMLQKLTDWLIEASALVISGDVITPARGDTIVWVTPAGETRTYELIPIDDSPEYYTQEAEGKRLRVHSQLIESEAA